MYAIIHHSLYYIHCILTIELIRIDLHNRTDGDRLQIVLPFMLYKAYVMNPHFEFTVRPVLG